MKVLVISKDGVTLPLLMARGERPTMRGFDTGERSRQRKRICGRMPPTPPPAQNVSQRSVTNIDLDPKCPAFLSPVRRNKKRSKVWKIKWVLEDREGRRGNNSFRSFPPSWMEGRVGEGRGWKGEPRPATPLAGLHGDTTARGGASQTVH